MRTPGMLVLVIGPSGAGKDTLIEAARQRLRNRNTVLFPKRMITRPADAGGEDHVAIEEAAFDQVEQNGGFLLSWRAHGLAYGVPADVRAALEEGKIVVVNGSRRVLPEAERKVDHVLALHVTASPETLARRLAARGRESEADILARLRRSAPVTTNGAPVVTILNDGSVAEAVEAFVTAIKTHGLSRRTETVRAE